MDATEASAALVAWAVDTCSELNNAYDYDPARISDALPIATAGVSEESTGRGDVTLGLAVGDGLDQTDLHVLRSSLLLVVTETSDETAARQLEGFVAALGASLAADQTLGSRVSAVSPYWRASYDPPFVQFDDGTKGRAATFSLVIAELI